MLLRIDGVVCPIITDKLVNADVFFDILSMMTWM